MLDVLAVAPHPDDVELSCSGTLVKMKRLGYKVGVVDLTRGEMGSKGTAKVRRKEMMEATEILGLDVRENLNMGDSKLIDTFENGVLLAEKLRRYKPKIILSPYWREIHPDHVVTHKIVRRAVFLSKMRKVELGLEEHKVNVVLYYPGRTVTFRPTLIVDVTDSFETKLRAVKAYSSQVTEEIIRAVEARSRFFGSLIGVEHGEPFVYPSPIPVKDLITLFQSGNRGKTC